MIFNFVNSFVYHITLLPCAFKESSIDLEIKITAFEIYFVYVVVARIQFNDQKAHKLTIISNLEFIEYMARKITKK